jgi:hypothetical protein
MTTKVKRKGAGTSEADVERALSGGENGDRAVESELVDATRRRKTKGRAIASVKPVDGMRDPAADGGDCTNETDAGISSICRELIVLQRYRAAAIKQRIRIDNGITATVARFFGYHAGLEEQDRERLWKQAGLLIKAIRSGGKIAIPEGARDIAPRVEALIINASLGSDGFQLYIDGIEKQMAKHAFTLPVYPWVESVRGFGAVMLAIIVGECGDLSSYANPGKVWRRMGCAPFQGRMGSTWKRKGGLTADEWTEFGYAPRRRSIAFNLADCLIKNNDGPYRERYDTVKAAKLAMEDEEWPKMRCHLHASLLCGKLALRDLWIEWNKRSGGLHFETERPDA